MNYKIRTNPKTGRGLYAEKEIFEGEPITTCELLVLSETDSFKLYGTDLQYYTFVYNETQDCLLLLGDGELFNHSDEPNVSYELKDYKGRKVMFFKCIRDVKDGEELLIDYNADTYVDISKYNISLTGVK